MRFWKHKWCEDELLCVSFPYLFHLAISKYGWVADVWNSIVKGGGWVLASLGRLMIRRLKVWSVLYWNFKQKGCIGMKKIGWFRRFQRVESFQSYPSIPFWSLVTLYCSRRASFGVLACHPRWLFLLGRQLGGKP